MRILGAIHDGVTRATRRVQTLPAFAALAATIGLTAAPAAAQDSGNGFLFGVPHSTFTIRTGYDRAFANSDLFSYVTNTYTVNRSAFSSPLLAAELGFRVNRQIDATVGLGYSRAVARSEYRDFVDNNNLPINQTTEFTRIPLTVNLKAYLGPRGQAVGRFAWVPASFTPYVGGGVGTMWYKFRQAGDFIDFTTNNVSSDALASSAWTPMVDAFAGADYTLTPGMALTGEARYSWAQGPVNDNYYSGFNRIDLSGLSVTAGLTFRF